MQHHRRIPCTTVVRPHHRRIVRSAAQLSSLYRAIPRRLPAPRTLHVRRDAARTSAGVAVRGLQSGPAGNTHAAVFQLSRGSPDHGYSHLRPGTAGPWTLLQVGRGQFRAERRLRRKPRHTGTGERSFFYACGWGGGGKESGHPSRKRYIISNLLCPGEESRNRQMESLIKQVGKYRKYVYERIFVFLLIEYWLINRVNEVNLLEDRPCQ